nr:hypothetical protein 48 [Balneolaceae bacterium]
MTEKHSDQAKIGEDFDVKVQRGDDPARKPALFEGQKVALCLPGGGAKGAFQAGVLARLAYHHPIYHWIAGVSVGALNGAMMATGQLQRMVSLWDQVTLQDVARKRGIARIAWEYAKYKLGISSPPQAIYSNAPLLDLLRKALAGKPFKTPFLCGSVNMASGKYTTWKYHQDQQYSIKTSRGVLHQKLESHNNGDHPRYTRRSNGDTSYLEPILASTAVPVIWDPVQVGDQWHVDGGLRNINPIKDLIMYDPDVILVIPTERGGGTPSNIGTQLDILEAAQRSMDVLLNEIFQNDISECRKINELVRQAESNGIDLRSSSGRVLKHYRLVVIEPGESLGDMMDFSRDTLQWRQRHGQAQARTFLQKEGLV